MDVAVHNVVWRLIGLRVQHHPEMPDGVLVSVEEELIFNVCTWDWLAGARLGLPSLPFFPVNQGKSITTSTNHIHFRCRECTEARGPQGDRRHIAPQCRH
jgi:hypothetical protein